MTLITNPSAQIPNGINEGMRFIPLWTFENFGAINVSDPEEFFAKVGNKHAFYPKHFQNIMGGKIHQVDVDALIRTGQIKNVEHLLSGGGKKWTDQTGNVITTAGKNDLLDVYFDVGTPVAMYVGLIDDTSGFSPSAGSTLSAPGGTEFSGYSGSRKAYLCSAAAAGVIANTGTAGSDPGPAQFGITTGDTLKAGFLTDQASGTSGLYFSEAAFSGGDRVVVATDTLNVTIQYTLS